MSIAMPEFGATYGAKPLAPGASVRTQISWPPSIGVCWPRGA
jgi:hypothetical protein